MDWKLPWGPTNSVKNTEGTTGKLIYSIYIHHEHKKF